MKAARADAFFVVTATGALALGSLFAIFGMASQAVLPAAAGALVFATALGLLTAAGLLSGALMVGLSAALPAVYSTDTVRVAAAAPVAAIVVFAWLISSSLDRRAIDTENIPVRSLLGMLAAMMLATIFADNVTGSLREVINFAILGFFLLAATDEFKRNRGSRDLVIDALVVSAGVCGILAVGQMLGRIPSIFPRWGTPYFRADLGFGQPNGLGLFLAMLLPLAVARKGIIAKLCAASALLGLVATYSRASWVAVIAVILFLPFFGRGRVALKLFAGLAVATVIVDVLSGGMLRDTVGRTFGDWVIEQRAALFLAGWQMFLDHPLVGVGPGGFADQVQAYAARITQLWDYQATPHNAYIQMAAEGGIIGVVTFLVFVRAALRTLHRNASANPQQLALLCSFIIVVIASLGIWPFAHGTGEVVMLIVALGATEAA